MIYCPPNCEYLWADATGQIWFRFTVDGMKYDERPITKWPDMTTIIACVAAEYWRRELNRILDEPVHSFSQAQTLDWDARKNACYTQQDEWRWWAYNVGLTENKR